VFISSVETRKEQDESVVRADVPYIGKVRKDLLEEAYPRLVRDTSQRLGFPCIHIISLNACAKVFKGRENRVGVKVAFFWSKDVCDDCNAVVFESLMEALKVFFDFLLGKRKVIIVRRRHLSVCLLLGNEIRMKQESFF
jgi:hypothetical protein